MRVCLQTSGQAQTHLFCTRSAHRLSRYTRSEYKAKQGATWPSPTRKVQNGGCEGLRLAATLMSDIGPFLPPRLSVGTQARSASGGLSVAVAASRWPARTCRRQGKASRSAPGGCHQERLQFLWEARALRHEEGKFYNSWNPGREGRRRTDRTRPLGGNKLKCKLCPPPQPSCERLMSRATSTRLLIAGPRSAQHPALPRPHPGARPEARQLAQACPSHCCCVRNKWAPHCNTQGSKPHPQELW